MRDIGQNTAFCPVCSSYVVALVPLRCWRLTLAVSRRAMCDVLEAQAAIGAVGSTALFGWVWPTTLAWKFLWPLCRGLLFEDDPLRKPLLDVLA